MKQRHPTEPHLYRLGESTLYAAEMERMVIHLLTISTNERAELIWPPPKRHCARSSANLTRRHTGRFNR